MQTLKKITSRLRASTHSLANLLGALTVGIALSGCGGGNSATDISKAENSASLSATQERTFVARDSSTGGSVVKYALTTNIPGQTEVVSSVPFSALEKSLLQASTSDEVDAILANQATKLPRSTLPLLQPPRVQ